MGNFERNVWCAKYSQCLNQAVETGKPFDCTGCRLQYTEGGKDGIADNFGLCLLFAAIFFPEVYKAYRRYQTKHDKRSKDQLDIILAGLASRVEGTVGGEKASFE